MIHIIGLQEPLLAYRDFVYSHDVIIKFEDRGTSNENKQGVKMPVINWILSKLFPYRPHPLLGHLLVIRGAVTFDPSKRSFD